MPISITLLKVIFLSIFRSRIILFQKNSFNSESQVIIYGGKIRVLLEGNGHKRIGTWTTFLLNSQKTFINLDKHLFWGFKTFPKLERRMDGLMISIVLGVRRGLISRSQGRKHVFFSTEDCTGLRGMRKKTTKGQVFLFFSV